MFLLGAVLYRRVSVIGFELIAILLVGGIQDACTVLRLHCSGSQVNNAQNDYWATTRHFKLDWSPSLKKHIGY